MASQRRFTRRTLLVWVVLLATLVQVVQLAVGTASASAAPGKPVVYLTFDDGPGPDTPGFLDLLAVYDIKATFFITGRAVTTNPGTARRITAEGHTVANHTWNHPRLTALSDAQIRSEFTATTEAIRATTGANPTCYRPPYGATNGRVHAQAVAAGLPNASWTTGRGSHLGLWDIDTNDWRLSVAGSGWTDAAMMRELNKAADGDTILMHDGFGRRTRGLAVLTSWLAVNHDRFDFQVLPGCGGRIVEPAMNDAQPETWHRFQIARLYRAYFDREPDAAGWEYWNREFSTGATLEDISFAFAQSSEFTSAAELDDAGFVTFVYRAVLDREPDAGGHQYWVEQLAAGMSRGELVIYFSEATEYIARTLGSVTGGCHTEGEVAASYRCLAASLPAYDWS